MLPGVVASDSDLVAELLASRFPPPPVFAMLDPDAEEDGDIAAAPRPGEGVDDRALEDALRDVLPLVEGAFSFVLLDGPGRPRVGQQVDSRALIGSVRELAA